MRQEYVRTNAKCSESSESPEKVEALLGPSALIFNVHSPAEFVIEVNTEVLIGNDLFNSLTTSYLTQVRAN